MSWSVIAQSISRELIKLGHDVDIFSTNGKLYFPEDLKQNMIGYVDEDMSQVFGREPDPRYQVQLSYTAFKNFPHYFQNGNTNRFGIWTYEFAGKNSIPPGFAKYYKYCDKILPPSQFAKQIFIDSGVPEDHMTVIPHGIDPSQIACAQPYKLKTDKKTKIFVNLAQVHRRKNIDGTLNMFGEAFSKKDDVCLVLKVSNKKPQQLFELNHNILLNEFKSKYKDHAEIEVIKEFIPNIYSLYKSCDIMFSASHTEAFGMTGLEAQAMGMINIAPKYGGFLDFLNDDNALLIDGKEFYVKPNMVYWSYQPGSKAFMPDVKSGAEHLIKAVKNKDQLKQKASHLAPEILEKYSWHAITSKVLDLVK